MASNVDVFVLSRGIWHFALSTPTSLLPPLLLRSASVDGNANVDANFLGLHLLKIVARGALHIFLGAKVALGDWPKSELNAWIRVVRCVHSGWAVFD